MGGLELLDISKQSLADIPDTGWSCRFASGGGQCLWSAWAPGCLLSCSSALLGGLLDGQVLELPSCCALPFLKELEWVWYLSSTVLPLPRLLLPA